MLPLRASRLSTDETVDSDGVPAVWNGAPLGGSAKSLGLVRPDDGESTATVTRQVPESAPSKADWTDGSDTLDRKSKPALAASTEEDDEEDEGDGPATVLKGRVMMTSASSDDDDLNETKRADDLGGEDNLETPVGLKKLTPLPGTSTLKTPAPAPSPLVPSTLPIPAPESGSTRVAPITIPTAPGAATAVMGQQTQAMPTPAHAWTPSTIPPGVVQAGPPMGMGAVIATKALALPPHKIALLVSVTLMMAALTFVFVRSHRDPAPGPVAATTPLFPPAVEVPPAPPPAIVLPPPAPTFTSQAQPQPTIAKAPPTPPVRRAPVRATTRTTIPVHREQ